MKNALLSILLILLVELCRAQSDRLPTESIGYLLTKATEQARLKNYSQAISIVDSALAIDNSNEPGYALKSELLWMKKEYYPAALCYEQAMLLDKDSSYLKGAYLFLGVLYEKAGYRDEAQKNYFKAIYQFENNIRENDRFFEYSNCKDYAVALILSGAGSEWKGLMSSPKFNKYKGQYKGKNRAEVLEAYWREYDGG